MAGGCDRMNSEAVLTSGMVFLILIGCGLAYELRRISKALRRIASRTEQLTRVVAYACLATPGQRAEHLRDYQASLELVKDFFESDVGRDVERIIMGKPEGTG